ncbi:EVE domain-containing protein [Marinicella rhabdoformis]|uniref:EVE domain-containing protein n=1 Tax=Marinicella rhabdoformis TaxID=2580566 RepID=UPI001C556392|nr:EVE domain-containing protein [Marinicella rhabdoformis]
MKSFISESVELLNKYHKAELKNLNKEVKSEFSENYKKFKAFTDSLIEKSKIKIDQKQHGGWQNSGNVMTYLWNRYSSSLNEYSHIVIGISINHNGLNFNIDIHRNKSNAYENLICNEIYNHLISKAKSISKKYQEYFEFLVEDKQFYFNLKNENVLSENSELFIELIRDLNEIYIDSNDSFYTNNQEINFCLWSTSSGQISEKTLAIYHDALKRLFKNLIEEEPYLSKSYIKVESIFDLTSSEKTSSLITEVENLGKGVLTKESYKHLKQALNKYQAFLKNNQTNTNYWIFQCNPNIYNIVEALNNEHVNSWKVAAHKTKIRKGDKVILWLTGKNSGCYALAEVISHVHQFEEEDAEKQYYLKPSETQITERVKIKVIKNMADNPILSNETSRDIAFSEFKAGNQGTNFEATEEQYLELLNWYQTKVEKRMKPPKNQILYGPPGTGKTYYLKDQLFDKYTSKGSSISKEQFFENVVSNCSWWKVIAIALLDLGKSKVSDIFEHEWVQKKASLSNSNTVRPTLWGQLQSHTINECEFVNVSNRMSPHIFTKTKDSYWEVLEEQVNELIPELIDLKNSVENYKADPDKVIKHYDFVTFHQSFAYEDFIEGIKPVFPEDEDEVKDLGYTVEDGVFKKLCIKAEKDPDNRYAIFIDEINRGNVSAIFGELITLVETDKRKGAKNEISITLPYSKDQFSVPSNLDIYGTMNTADRSVEALDTALRRRFEFKEVMPDMRVIESHEVDGIKLPDLLSTINQRIELLIDRDHTIGHSYFIGIDTKKKLAKAFNNKIMPLLQEFFYGDYGKIGLVLGKGFVEKKKNDDISFANFTYENLNDFKNPSYVLKTVNSENIMEAVSDLFNKKETN